MSQDDTPTYPHDASGEHGESCGAQPTPTERDGTPPGPSAGRRRASIAGIVLLWVGVALVALVVTGYVALAVGLSGQGSVASAVVPVVVVLSLLAALVTVRLGRTVRANRRPPPATAEEAGRRRRHVRRGWTVVAVVVVLGSVGVAVAVVRARPPKLDGTVATLAKAIGCRDVAMMPPTSGALEQATCTRGSTLVVIATFAGGPRYLGDRRGERLVCSALTSGSRLYVVDGGTWLVGTRGDTTSAAATYVDLPASGVKSLVSSSC